MDAATRLALDRQLCHALYSATNAVTRAYRPLLGELGLTYPQYLAMIVLWEEGRTTVGRMADRLRLAPNAVTPLADRLDRLGLLTRRPDPTDRRRVWLEPTEAGLALRDRAAAAQERVEADTGLSEPELETLREKLKSLVRHMEG